MILLFGGYFISNDVNLAIGILNEFLGVYLSKRGMIEFMEIKCPRCGSLEAVSNVEPENSSNNSQDPAFRCHACRVEFGTVSGKSSFSSIVSEVILDINGLYTDQVNITCSNKKRGYVYQITSKKHNIDKKGEIPLEVWNEICEGLFDECYLSSWKKYWYNPDIIDGTIWNLEVRFDKKHALSFHGCNGYAPYWNQLLELFFYVFEEAELDSKAFLI